MLCEKPRSCLCVFHMRESRRELEGRVVDVRLKGVLYNTAELSLTGLRRVQGRVGTGCAVGRLERVPE